MEVFGLPHWTRRTLLALLGAGLAAGCADQEDRSQLPTLLEDPMAAPDLLGLDLLSGHEQGYHTVLGQPSFATVQRTFGLRDEADNLADAVAEATAAGWQPSSNTDTTWEGTKVDPPRRCTIAVDPAAEELRITLQVVGTPR